MKNAKVALLSVSVASAVACDPTFDGFGTSQQAFVGSSTVSPDYHTYFLTLDEFYRDYHNNDYATALELVQRSPRCGQSCEVRLACNKQYRITRTVDICKHLRIVGCGGAGAYSSSVFVVEGANTGFFIGHGNYCASKGYPDSHGAYSSFEQLGIVDSHAATLSNDIDDHVAIDVKARTILDRVWIKGFRHGVRVDADANPSNDPSDPAIANGNMTRIRDSLIEDSHHAGIYFDDRDSNAGLVESTSLVSNCQDAQAIANNVGTNNIPAVFRIAGSTVPQCAGIFESSYLGNTFIANHASGIRDETGRFHPGYFTEAGVDNQETVWAGNYAESNLPRGYLGRKAITVGGTARWEQNVGLIIKDQTITKPVLIYPEIQADTSGAAELYLMRWRLNNNLIYFNADYRLNGSDAPLYPSTYGLLYVRENRAPTAEYFKMGLEGNLLATQPSAGAEGGMTISPID